MPMSHWREVSESALSAERRRERYHAGVRDFRLRHRASTRSTTSRTRSRASRHGQPVGSLHGRCCVHRAEILRLRGCCADAETQILKACEELRPYLRREFGWPLTELGRIRFRKGDIQGAEDAFLAAHEAGWDPQPGLALVHLARGDVARAAASIREAFDRPSTIPSKEFPPNTALRRAPLLEAQVEIEIAAGNLVQARAAAEELGRVAALFQSRAFEASAALALGRVRLAEGDTATARSNFETAARQWGDIGAPYETALARMGLAHALRAAGKEVRARSDAEPARRSRPPSPTARASSRTRKSRSASACAARSRSPTACACSMSWTISASRRRYDRLA